MSLYAFCRRLCVSPILLLHQGGRAAAAGAYRFCVCQPSRLCLSLEGEELMTTIKRTEKPGNRAKVVIGEGDAVREKQ